MVDLIRKYAVWIAVGATIIACLFAFWHLLLPLDLFLWDESHHGFYSRQIYRDLCDGDWGQFWAHTNHQALWMPLHSWISGLFLYLFGFSYVSARASSLFLFFCSAILLYLTGEELSKEKGWLIGLVSVGLFLTSPIILHLAVLNMQDLLGIFFLLLLTWVMLRFWPVEKPWKYLLVGFLISVAYWTKSNFGIQLILGVGLYQLSLLWRLNRLAAPVNEPKTKKKKARYNEAGTATNTLLTWMLNNIYIVAGFLPLFLLWWLTPPFERKFALGVLLRTQGVGNALFYPSVGIPARVIFYLQSLVSSYTFSLWLGLGLLAAIGYAVYRFADKKLRLLLIIFLANLAMIAPIGNIQERYLSTAAPLVFVLLAYGLVILAERWPAFQLDRQVTFGLAGLLLLLIGGDALSLPGYTKEVANRAGLFPIYKDYHNKFNPPFIFGWLKRPAVTYPMDQVKKLPNFKQTPNSSLNDIMNYFSSNIERNRSVSSFICYHELSPYAVYWHFNGWPAPVLTGNDLAYNPHYFWAADYFIEVEPAPASPYYEEWIDKAWKEKYAPLLLKKGYVKLVSSKEFCDLGLTAYIFKRVKQI